MKKLKGFIFLYREMLDWRWYKDIPVKTLYIHILLSAAFKKQDWEDITIHPGQLVTSLESLAKETGLTYSQVRTALKKLEKSKNIACTPTNKYTLITVDNWEKIQYSEKKAAGRMTDKSQTDDKQIANKSQHRNNINKYNNADNVIRPETSYDMEEFKRRAEELPVYKKRQTSE